MDLGRQEGCLGVGCRCRCVSLRGTRPTKENENDVPGEGRARTLVTVPYVGRSRSAYRPYMSPVTSVRELRSRPTLLATQPFRGPGPISPAYPGP